MFIENGEEKENLEKFISDAILVMLMMSLSEEIHKIHDFNGFELFILTLTRHLKLMKVFDF